MMKFRVYRQFEVNFNFMYMAHDNSYYSSSGLTITLLSCVLKRHFVFLPFKVVASESFSQFIDLKTDTVGLAGLV